MREKLLSARRHGMAILLVLSVACAVGLLASASASAAEQPAGFELSQYEDQYEVSEAEAEEALVTQEEAAGISQFLESALGSNYAGVWFDNESNEFIVPLIHQSAGPQLREELRAAKLTDAVRTPEALYSMNALEAAEATLGNSLAEPMEDGLVFLSVNVPANELSVKVADSASSSQVAEITQAAEAAPVKVGIVRSPAESFEIAELSCTAGSPVKWCSKPLRGGVIIGHTYVENKTLLVKEECSAGFKAIGNTFGNRFLLTAGHCITESEFGPNNWATELPNTEDPIIGNAEEWSAEGIGHPAGTATWGDWAKINVNGSVFDTNPWPSIIVNEFENNEWHIEAESGVYVGEFVCHQGASTGKSCATVRYPDAEAGGQEHLIGVTNACGYWGDSGGPVFAGHVALGLVSAAALNAEGKIPPCGEDVILFHEITEADDQMGVTVGPRLGTAPLATAYLQKGMGYEEGKPGVDATLEGFVNPHGITSNYAFEYGTTASYGQATLIAGAGSGYQDVNVSKVVSGLLPETTYHYRIEAQNAAGAVTSPDQTFVTLPARRPIVSNLEANPERLAATVKGTVDGRTMDAHYHFEYGPTTAYGTSIPVPDADAGSSVKVVEKKIEGLEGTYHFRLVASNPDGTTYSPDREFYVQPRPSVTTEAASNVTPTGGTLNGIVNPVGAATNYFFEYGLTSSYGSKTGEIGAGSGTTNTKVSATINQLAFGTTYHYRLAAENSGGIRYGSDREFTPGWSTSSVPYSEAEGATTDLKGVSCPSQTNCFASGGRTNPPGGSAIVDHWSGGAWVSQDVPAAKETAVSADLPGISCTSGTSCMAVGYYTTSGNEFPQADILSGGTWTAQALPLTSPAYSGRASSVSCAVSSSCIAVGSKYMHHTGEADTINPYVVRWDGTKWTEDTVPQPAGTQALLMSVSCGSTIDCWALGYGAVSGTEAHPFVDHWNGSAWSLVTVSDPEASPLVTGLSISCVSTNACILGGTFKSSSGTYLPYVDSWNGSKWEAKVVPLPAGSSAGGGLTGVACTSPGVCEALGASSSGAPFADRKLNGTWEAQVATTPAASTATQAIACPVENSCMAVGYTATGPQRPFAAQYSPGSPPGAPQFALSFGATGSGPGQLSGARGVATDHKGHIWVTDSGNNRVEEFNEKGEFISQFGKAGSGNGEFNAPWGIAVTSAGNIWVVDVGNSRLQEFNEKGEFIQKFGTPASGSSQGTEFVSPEGIAVAPGGMIWVADTYGARIGEFRETVSNESERFVRNVATTGTGNPGLASPVGLAVDSLGNLWATDQSGNRLNQYNSEGAFLKTVGSSGSGNGQFTTPKGVAISPSGNIIVVDKGNNRVEEFAPDGTYLFKFGSGGSGPENFSEPRGVAFGMGNSVFVVDTGNNHVNKWTVDSTPRFSFTFGSVGSGPGQFNGPRGVAADHKGHVWVVDRINNRVQEFNEKGEFIRQFGSSGSGNGQFNTPGGIAVSPAGNVWVVDSGNYRVEEFNEKGEFMQKFGSHALGNSTLTQFVGPEGIAVAPGGMLWVSDPAGGRVGEFRESLETGARFVRNVSKVGGAGNPGLVNPIGLAVDPQGNIWVADESANRIVEFNSEGFYQSSFGTTGSGNGQLTTPKGIAISPAGNLAVVDRGNNRIEEFAPDGTYLFKFGSGGSGPENFSEPLGVAFGAGNAMFFGDSGNNRVDSWMAE